MQFFNPARQEMRLPRRTIIEIPMKHRKGGTDMDLDKWRGRRLPWMIVLPIAAVMLCIFAVSLLNSNSTMKALKKREAELTSELSSLQTKETNLRIRLANVDSSAQLEAAARSEEFVKAGELRFVIDNSEGQLDKYTLQEWEIMMDERELGQY